MQDLVQNSEDGIDSNEKSFSPYSIDQELEFADNSTISQSSESASVESLMTAASAVTPTEEALGVDQNNNHILVAEDDIFISDIYDVKLTSAGYRVEIAHNGKEAIEKLQAGVRPNLMLLDIVMPYVDGFGVLEEFSKHPEWSDIPIVLLTNLSQKEDIDRAISLGARDYLIKSHFTPSEVLSKVEKYIRKD